MITTDDLKDVYMHDQFVNAGFVPRDVLMAIDNWCRILQGAGWNPHNVSTNHFESALIVMKPSSTPFPVAPEIQAFFKHKRTKRCAGVTAFPPSHYPTVAVLNEIAVKDDEDPT